MLENWCQECRIPCGYRGFTAWTVGGRCWDGDKNHPLLSSLTAIDAALDEVAAVNPIYLTIAVRKAVMVLGTRLRSRLDALRMGVLAVADDVAAQTGPTPMGDRRPRPFAALRTHSHGR